MVFVFLVAKEAFQVRCKGPGEVLRPAASPSPPSPAGPRPIMLGHLLLHATACHSLTGPSPTLGSMPHNGIHATALQAPAPLWDPFSASRSLRLRLPAACYSLLFSGHCPCLLKPYARLPPPPPPPTHTHTQVTVWALGTTKQPLPVFGALLSEEQEQEQGVMTEGSWGYARAARTMMADNRQLMERMPPEVRVWGGGGAAGSWSTCHSRFGCVGDWGEVGGGRHSSCWCACHQRCEGSGETGQDRVGGREGGRAGCRATTKTR